MRRELSEFGPTLTVEECAEVLGLSRGSMYEAIRAGEIPHLRLGRRILIPRAQLALLLGEPATTEAHQENGHARQNPGSPGAQHSQEDVRDGGLAEVGSATRSNRSLGHAHD